MADNANVDSSEGTLLDNAAVITCIEGYEFDSAMPDDPVTSVCQEDKTWSTNEGCVSK